MTTSVTYDGQENPTEATLFVACELRDKTWKLGFTAGADTVAEFAEPPF